MITNDYQLSARIHSIREKFDKGFFSYEDMRNKINEAIDERISNLPQPAPTEDRKSLLSQVSQDWEYMRFKVDNSEESFSIGELIDANEDFDIIIVNQLVSLKVGEVYSPGMGADVERVV